jgi:hypothetical protein
LAHVYAKACQQFSNARLYARMMLYHCVRLKQRERLRMGFCESKYDESIAIVVYGSAILRAIGVFVLRKSRLLQKKKRVAVS